MNHFYRYTTYLLVAVLMVAAVYIVLSNQKSKVQAYFNDPLGLAETQLGEPWYIPASFVWTENQKDRGVRFADVNGDGLPDLLESSTGGSDAKLYLNNGSGWSDTGTGGPFGFYSSDKRMADVNGDGLIDILTAEDATRGVFINNGSNGWTQDASWVIPVPFIAFQKDNGVQLADVNGDGLVDILWALEEIGNNPAHNEVYLNNGTSWVAVP